MSRDTSLWTMVILLVVSGVALGWVRGRTIARAYLRICADLKKANIELSQAELRNLFTQLQRNPKTLLAADQVDESHGMKVQHVQELVSRLKLFRIGYYTLLVVGVAAVFLFEHLWTRQ